MDKCISDETHFHIDYMKDLRENNPKFKKLSYKWHFKKLNYKWLVAHLLSHSDLLHGAAV